MANLTIAAIPRRSDLTYEEFVSCFASKNLPVILVGALSEWQAMDKWTPDYFAKKYRGRKVCCRGETAAIAMDEYICQLDESNAENPAAYLRNLNIQTDFPELVEILRRHGRPVLPEEERKQRVTMYLDRDVLARLKAGGKGWQTRANAKLREALGL